MSAGRRLFKPVITLIFCAGLFGAGSGCSVSFAGETADSGALDANVSLDAEGDSGVDANVSLDAEVDSGVDAEIPVDAGGCQPECVDPEVCREGECCLPGEETESICDDGVDNDCDGLTDCADPDCHGVACDDGDQDTINDACDVVASACVGDPCTWVHVCDRCPTGSCEDVLIYEDVGCGCVSTVSAPNCDEITYDVDCGGGLKCTYERRNIMTNCNCREECQLN